MIRPRAERVARGLWWDRAWTLVDGCTAVSEACSNCWAAREAHMRSHQKKELVRRRYAGLLTPDGCWTGKVHPRIDRLGLPLQTKRPTVWAVWNDLFHLGLPQGFLARAFSAMAWCPAHMFLVLTKRPDRAYAAVRHLQLLGPIDFPAMTEGRAHWLYPTDYSGRVTSTDWPLPNVGIGTTVESQEHVDRLGHLLGTPAAMRFVSCEPLLGPVDFPATTVLARALPGDVAGPEVQGIDWVIVGCESGGQRRHTRIEWIRDIVDQCREAGIAVFVKQIEVPRIDADQLRRQADNAAGMWLVSWETLIERHGSRVSKDPREWPADLRVREFPAVMADHDDTTGTL